MSVLNLPGSLRGLLRECSPVITLPHGHRAWVTELPDPLSHFRRRDQANDQHFRICGEDGGLRHGEDLALRLEDATGRAHATWWLAGHTHLAQPAEFSGVLWECIKSADHVPGMFLQRWHLTKTGSNSIRSYSPDLDPDDPQLLADGSRWVDAEALRLMCLRAASLTD